ncbi:MAG: hypothetical protein Q4A32_01555 [Lachnospiraceae bacterium]|nr:hypothetical protein [Lachnospiraceae bacterium]
MNTKMTKDIIPEGFTLGLAFVDALPVIFFAGSMFLIGKGFSSTLFMIGALLCLAGGAGKVLWKIIVVTKKKNVWPLFVQMRILMSVGFLLMICSIAVNADRMKFAEIIRSCTVFPSAGFFLAGILGMVLMTVSALCLDSSDVRANWTEQLINGLAQGAIFLGILFMK